MGTAGARSVAAEPGSAAGSAGDAGAPGLPGEPGRLTSDPQYGAAFPRRKLVARSSPLRSDRSAGTQRGGVSGTQPLTPRRLHDPAQPIHFLPRTKSLNARQSNGAVFGPKLLTSPYWVFLRP